MIFGGIQLTRAGQELARIVDAAEIPGFLEYWAQHRWQSYKPRIDPVP